MSTLIYKYPLDLTGVSSNNLVIGEIHSLSLRNNAIVCSQGYFYTESLIVKDSLTNEVLVKGEDYKALQLHQELTEITGKEICGVIVIVKENFTNDVIIDYQTVGGEFSNKTQALINMIETLGIDTRTVVWGQIIGTPSNYAPTGHLHDIGDLYGFEHLVNALENIRVALILGDELSHEEMRSLIIAINTNLQDHIDNKNNPHEVDKIQLQLGNVENYPVASEEEMLIGARNDRYVTPNLVKIAIDFFAGNLLQEHIDDKNNPHQVTKTQVGLSNVQNYSIATKEEAEEGISTDKYMTPLRTKEAIDVLAGNLLQEHIDDKNNPHQVTKTQVGLNLVENYSVATKEEAEIGTANNKYMTPLRTKEAFQIEFNSRMNVVSGQTFQGYVTATQNTASGVLYTFTII